MRGLERFFSPGDRRYTFGDFAGVPEDESRYPDPTYCEERLTIVDSLVREIRSTNAEVTFVLLPLHPDVVAQAPELHERARSDLVDLATELGVELIVVETPYSDAETSDGWHANEVGRARVSTDVLARLN